MSQEQPFLQQVRNTANVTLDVLLTNLSANISTVYAETNLVYDVANSAIVVSGQAYDAGNSGITIAKAAYAQANTAYGQANAARTQANTAYGQANAAYTTANVGISSSGVSPGTYGSGLVIPVLTTDIRGRITLASTVAPAQFTPSGRGVVPASGGGTTNFLRADGNWAAPAFVIQQSLGPNGYRKYSDGFIEIWGRFTTTGGLQAVSFSTFSGFAFPTQCFNVILTAASVTDAFYTNGYPSASGFTIANGGGIPMMFVARGN